MQNREIEDERQIQENDIRLKNAYRRKEGLLTSDDIESIRGKYGITQSDLCALLGWGGKTITRYESHQVQDRAHDTILKKIDRDPEWFLSLLRDARDNLTEEAYQKYFGAATTLYEADQDQYFRKASSKMITSLYKVKLMKLMWYADALSYKKRGCAITGLVYLALPMGAVPVGHNSIIDLRYVPCEEVDMGETNAYHFSLNEKTDFPSLSADDKAILDMVIEKLGKKTKDEIVSFMHKERAYIETAPRDVIQFKYAESLQI